MVPMSHARILSERMTGIEPAPLTWKDRALPLCNIRICLLLSHTLEVVQTEPLAAPTGFEPVTLELTALCSAVELKGNIKL